MARYSVLVTVYDNEEDREVAQEISLETDDPDEMAEEFEELSGVSFEDAEVDDEDEPDADSDDED